MTTLKDALHLFDQWHRLPPEKQKEILHLMEGLSAQKRVAACPVDKSNNGEN